MTNFKEGARRLGMTVSVLSMGLYIGYHYPRDVELESMAPVEFHYEITPEAARELILKSVDGCR